MRLRKKVIIFDLENGEDSITLRLEQGLANKSKSEILSGQYDKEVQKIIRKYNRLKVEVVVKRLPAYSTAADLKYWLEYYKREHGLVFQQMLIDYVGLMGSLRPFQDDNARISNAFLDVKNLAAEFNIEHTWTPHHIGRNAYIRRATKYEASDTAKCIDIHRHVDGMFGVQQNEEEKEGNVYRIEVIDQRDGPPDQRAYFWGNERNQRITEFTKKQVEELGATNINPTKNTQPDKDITEKHNKAKSDI